MYPLFESIKVIDGRFTNLEWHQQRVNRSREKLGISSKRLDLASSLVIPEEFQIGLVKCRVPYGERLGSAVYSKYIRKKLSTLQQVECEPFEYSLKYQDRSKLDQLYEFRGICDEVLITVNGIVTDTSFSNVVLYDGTAWYTPEDPILEGTQRAKLLAAGIIHKAKIQTTDLGSFEKLMLINAMLEFDPKVSIPIENIRLWQQRQVDFDQS